MSDIKYSERHEWIRRDGDEAIVGITNHAQQQLGDVVYVELPEIGVLLSQGDQAGVIESVKAASEIYAPVSGTVTATNDALQGNPTLINEAPEGEGWIYRITLSDPSQLSVLLDSVSYQSFVE